MPEGHAVHRIALQFRRNFVGKQVQVSSPQGRFSADAALIDGRTMVDARAIGKQLFLEFENGLWLRVHLGIYGAWDFAGEITVDDTIRSARGRMGQTNQRGTVPGEDVPDALLDTPVLDSRGEDSIASMGAPRRARLRMSESEKEDDSAFAFPPEPVGAVRARLLTDTAVADLRGPTACEVLDDAAVARVIGGLGPDPLVDDGPEVEDRVAGLTVVTGRGDIIETDGPARATRGPDWTQLLLGSEGTLGIITSARLRLAPAPAIRILLANSPALPATGSNALVRPITVSAPPRNRKPSSAMTAAIRSSTCCLVGASR